MILRISATAAAIMIIWPNRLPVSPLSLSTGNTIATEVVIMISEKYQILGISMICERETEAKYESNIANTNCVNPTNKGFFKKRAQVNFLRGNEAIIWSTSISRPLKNIRKRKPKNAKKSRIRKLSSVKFPNKNFPTTKPNMISIITIGILFNFKSDISMGAIHAITATTKNG
jgi:hypothetical protein